MSVLHTVDTVVVGGSISIFKIIVCLVIAAFTNWVTNGLPEGAVSSGPAIVTQTASRDITGVEGTCVTGIIA
jgi:hypothetical protein